MMVSGQRVSLRTTNGTISFGTVFILKPDGTTLASTAFASGAYFLDAVTLPSNGTYTVLVDPSSTSVGSVTVTLYTFTDATGVLTIGASPTAVTLSTSGQNGSFTFSGTSGQQVTVRVTQNTITLVTVKLLKPEGTQLATSGLTASSSFNLSTQTLSATGTYTVIVDAYDIYTGSLQLAVTSP